MKILSTFSSWWQLRSRQERIILSIGGGIIASTLFYTLVMVPLKNNIEDLEKQWRSNRELASWIAPRLAYLKTKDSLQGGKLIDPTVLLTTIDAAVRQSDLSGAVVEVSQTDKNGVQIRFQAVSVDNLLSWLAIQKVNHNINVAQFIAQKIKTKGLADATVVLKINPPLAKN